MSVHKILPRTYWVFSADFLPMSWLLARWERKQGLYFLNTLPLYLWDPFVFQGRGILNFWQLLLHDIFLRSEKVFFRNYFNIIANYWLNGVIVFTWLCWRIDFKISIRSNIELVYIRNIQRSQPPFIHGSILTWYLLRVYSVVSTIELLHWPFVLILWNCQTRSKCLYPFCSACDGKLQESVDGRCESFVLLIFKQIFCFLVSFDCWKVLIYRKYVFTKHVFVYKQGLRLFPLDRL